MHAFEMHVINGTVRINAKGVTSCVCIYCFNSTWINPQFMVLHYIATNFAHNPCFLTPWSARHREKGELFLSEMWHTYNYDSRGETNRAIIQRTSSLQDFVKSVFAYAYWFGQALTYLC